MAPPPGPAPLDVGVASALFDIQRTPPTSRTAQQTMVLLHAVGTHKDTAHWQAAIVSYLRRYSTIKVPSIDYAKAGGGKGKHTQKSYGDVLLPELRRCGTQFLKVSEVSKINLAAQITPDSALWATTEPPIASAFRLFTKASTSALPSAVVPPSAPPSASRSNAQKLRDIPSRLRRLPALYQKGGRKGKSRADRGDSEEAPDLELVADPASLDDDGDALERELNQRTEQEGLDEEELEAEEDISETPSTYPSLEGHRIYSDEPLSREDYLDLFEREFISYTDYQKPYGDLKLHRANARARYDHLTRHFETPHDFESLLACQHSPYAGKILNNLPFTKPRPDPQGGPKAAPSITSARSSATDPPLTDYSYFSYIKFFPSKIAHFSILQNPKKSTDRTVARAKVMSKYHDELNKRRVDCSPSDDYVQWEKRSPLAGIITSAMRALDGGAERLHAGKGRRGVLSRQRLDEYDARAHSRTVYGKVKAEVRSVWTSALRLHLLDEDGLGS